MARPCSACTHPQRTKIDEAILEGVSLRKIAARFGLNDTAVHRHKQNHIAAALLKSKQAQDSTSITQLVAEAEAKKAADTDHANRVMDRLEVILDRVNRLFDACDEWLTDPENPERYTIEPRSEDIKVIYTQTSPEGKEVRKKERLSILLRKLEERDHGDFRLIEVKHADPRKLILETAGELRQGVMLHLSILETFYSIQKIRTFQEICFQEISNASPEIRQRIIEGLRRQWDARKILELP